MKIVVADDLPASALDLLRAEGWEVDARTGRTPDQLAGDLADADAIVVRSATKVTAPLIAAAPRLRVIARAGTGVDNVDVPAASARGIVVMNAPGANSISVAELALGQMLALARHLPAADAAMKQGKWEKKKFLGEELRDKTLGLAGLGRIGQEVARRAASFDMRLIAHDPFISEQVARDLGVELVSMDDLFARADYISLHMPSNEKTRHIVDAARLAKAKKGIRLVNTARGDLIDEGALADAIEALRPAMGNRVFGCDICQEVCPFTRRFAIASSEPDYRPGRREALPVMANPPDARRVPPRIHDRAPDGAPTWLSGTGSPDLVDLMGMSRPQWDVFAHGRAVRRAGYAGFLRNVAIALGNWGAPAAVPPLAVALNHDEPLVRAHAAWALGRVGGQAALRALAARVDTDPSVRIELAAALEGLRGRDAGRGQTVSSG